MPPNSNNIGDIVLGLKDQMKGTADGVLGLPAAYEAVVNNNSTFLTLFQIVFSSLCVCFIILRMIQNIYKNAELLKRNPDAEPIFGPRELWKSILMCFAISFYQIIFDALEPIMVEISDSVVFDQGHSAKIFAQALGSFVLQASRDLVAETAAHAGDITIFGFNVGGIAKSAAAMMAPNKFVYAFCGIAALVAFFNQLLSVMAYMDRSLILLVLNVLAPLCFALSLVDGFKQVISRFFTAYMTVFLILPFVLIGFEILDTLYLNLSTLSGIFDAVAEETAIRESLNSFGNMAADAVVDAGSTLANMTNYSVFYRLPLLVLIVALKIKYASLISTTIWKILN